MYTHFHALRSATLLMVAVFTVAGLLLVPGSTSFAEEGTRVAVPGGVYDKPFIKKEGRGAIIGGYMDHEFFWSDKGRTFDQHRFVPFINSMVADRILVMAEIEFEHGGFVKGAKNGDTDGEIKIEYATLDISFAPFLSFRGGVILSPLGRFNLTHDSPQRDLTNRPLVARQIIPTTLSEAGMGFFGTFFLGAASLVGYEIYVVNGFNEKIIGDGTTRIRKGRGSQKSDNNDGKSLVGRVNFSPILGLDVGGSFHVGAYDDEGEDYLTIVSGDVDFVSGPIHLRGNFAFASIDGAPENSDSQFGVYGQIGCHFLRGSIPTFPDSVFTGTLRFDFIDFEDSDETRYTLGLNWRPVEDTVLKLDYEMYDEDEDSDGLIFSVASYF